jgi:hypothetical protein
MNVTKYFLPPLVGLLCISQTSLCTSCNKIEDLSIFGKGFLVIFVCIQIQHLSNISFTDLGIKFKTIISCILLVLTWPNLLCHEFRPLLGKGTMEDRCPRACDPGIHLQPTRKDEAFWIPKPRSHGGDLATLNHWFKLS